MIPDTTSIVYFYVSFYCSLVSLILLIKLVYMFLYSFLNWCNKLFKTWFNLWLFFYISHCSSRNIIAMYRVTSRWRCRLQRWPSLMQFHTFTLLSISALPFLVIMLPKYVLEATKTMSSFVTIISKIKLLLVIF